MFIHSVLSGSDTFCGYLGVKFGEIKPPQNIQRMQYLISFFASFVSEEILASWIQIEFYT